MYGVEWVIEAHGCTFSGGLPAIKDLFDELIEELSLHRIGDGQWHVFPDAGGVTGLQLLRESHLACHTFPEFGSMCLNVFCCLPRPRADFEEILTRQFGATRVQVRQIERPYEQ